MVSSDPGSGKVLTTEVNTSHMVSRVAGTTKIVCSELGALLYAISIPIGAAKIHAS